MLTKPFTTSVIISRGVYDRLISVNESYMIYHWASFDKKWFIEGVKVSGPFRDMLELVKIIRGLDK